MKSAAHPPSKDPLTGYILSVAIGLMASGWMAGVLVDQYSILTGWGIGPKAEVNIAAGLFIGTAAANPIGAITTRTALWRVAIRFGLGFVAGALIQIILFTPLAGEGMSNFLFLTLAAMAVPTSIFLSRLQAYFESRNMAPLKKIGQLIETVLNWSDRLIFVLLMMISFGCFWFLDTNVAQVGVVLTIVAGATVMAVARKEAICDMEIDREEADYQAWLALDPETGRIDPFAAAFSKIKSIFTNLLPGAILFAGMTRIAMIILAATYPTLSADLSQPVETMQNFGIFAVSGLGVVLFGMMGLLGICLTILRMVGSLQNWTSGHIRESYLNLIRMMYFRPIGRAET